MLKKLQKSLLGVGAIAAVVIVASLVYFHTKFSASPGSEGNSQIIRIHDDKLLLVTSFYPLYYFVEQIAGERAIVINLTPNGVEPHDYEPSPREIAEAGSASAVFILGHSFEPWAGSLPREIAVQILDDFSATTSDPHIWLDPISATKIVNRIADHLEKIDPAGSSTYEENKKTLVAELAKLDSEYVSALQDCSLRDIVTSHSAFGHLASRYGLNQISLAGLSPDAEPSAQKLAQIATLAKSRGIKYIFSESLVNPQFSQVVASEAGVQTLVLNPLEGLTESDVIQGKDYFTVMRENLTNLTLALQCKK